ncbi:MAG TPA: phenylacetate--CoA ligase, partial [Pyrodictium sp.]|nr:phenylacetate--CoA ligase [Pyrodictium sp.]
SEPGVNHHYQIIVEREGNLDRMYVVVEAAGKISDEEKQRLASELQHRLHEVLMINPRVQVVDPGELPRQEGGKAKRIIDKRKM